MQRNLGFGFIGASIGALLVRVFTNPVRHGTVFTPGNHTAVSKFLLRIVPALDGKSHKVQAGRIGVLGGSKDYTGAAFYTGQAALNIGADLLYMLTAEEAAIPIKSYSPELMVSAVYSAKWIDGPDKGINSMVTAVKEVLPKLHTLIIGPGMGRDPHVLTAVGKIVLLAREQQLPLVFDADALWLITQQPKLVSGYERSVLMPNKIEYIRLRNKVLGIPNSETQSTDGEEELKMLCTKLGHVTIIKKGPIDVISNGRHVLHCNVKGSPRRSGGIGDILSGVMGTILAWTHRRPDTMSEETAQLWAAKSACTIVRLSARAAFQDRKRATTSPDILQHIGDVFENVSPASFKYYEEEN